MNTFTIKDIDGFTGIKAHTIRIWEQRYNYFKAQRKKSGMEQTITNIIDPFLERIGILWLTNNVIPAQEHFASNIIRSKILAPMYH